LLSLLLSIPRYNCYGNGGLKGMATGSAELFPTQQVASPSTPCWEGYTACRLIIILKHDSNLIIIC